MQLRPYQERVIKSTISSLKAGNKRILVGLPTGGGKTIIASEIVRLALEWDKHIIFVVDREELVLQTLDKFKRVYAQTSVLKAGLEHLYNPNSLVQIVGLQTYHARKPSLDCDVLIIDEIHQGYGQSMQEGLIKQFSNAKLIGLSATPICSKGYLLQGFDDYINDVQTSDLIKMGFLAKPITYAPANCTLDLNSVDMVGDDYNQKQVDDIVINLDHTSRIVDEWEKLAVDKKTLVFANSIAHAELLYKEFIRRGYTSSAVIHSRTENLKEQRANIKNKQIIINCGILTTGYDDPDIECVLLARPTAILRLYLQIVGRGLRITDTKKECLILDCANCVSKHGLPEDLRYYVPAKPKSNEPLFIECPMCGNIQEIYKKECEICGFDLRLEISNSGGGKTKKKDIDRLVKIKSMQDEMYNALRELVKLRGYKSGYAFFLFKDLLSNAGKQGTGAIYYNKIMRRIDKCKNGRTRAGKEYKLQWLKHQ